MNLQEERLRRIIALRHRIPKRELQLAAGPPQRGFSISHINDALQNLDYNKRTESLFTGDPLLAYLKRRH